MKQSKTERLEAPGWPGCPQVTHMRLTRQQYHTSNWNFCIFVRLGGMALPFPRLPPHMVQIRSNIVLKI